MRSSRLPLRILVTCLATAFPLIGSLLADNLPKMYWSDRGANTIRRANLDGTEVELLVSGLGQARGLDVDFTNRILYWNDNGFDRIQRRTIDPGPVEDLVTSGLSFPAGIDLDMPGGKMYWADQQTGKIQRANLDGSDVEDLVTGLDSPYYVRLDTFQGHIYWTDYGTDKIQRANLDGSNLVDLVTTGLQLPRGIDLDLAGGKMYWADRGTDQIQRANLDGSEIETLYTIIPPPGIDAAPHGVALDVERGHVYWVDNGTVKIQRSQLDGSEVVDLLTADSGFLSRPWEIVLEFPPGEPLPGDFNQDGILDARDVDQLTQVILDETHAEAFDLNHDLRVDRQDHAFWVHDLKGTTFGDANLDGEFNTGDLVSVLEIGEYEDLLTENSGWSDGDWNADREFDTQDFVLALQEGSYEMGTRRPVAVIPEPSTASLALLGMTLWFISPDRRGSRIFFRRTT